MQERQLIEPEMIKVTHFKGLEDATQTYLKKIGYTVQRLLPATAAWPDDKGIYHYSNDNGWNFDPSALSKIGITVDRVFNDFEASSYGALAVSKEELKILKRGENEGYPVVILGAGTGLGLAYGLPDDEGWRVQTTFGARMLLACHTKEQFEIAQAAQEISKHERILEFEDLASGRGLPLLYRAYCKVNGKPDEILTAEEICDLIENEASLNTLRLFHEFLGIFIHSAVMFTHGFGGVYLNGGMFDRLVEKKLFDFGTIEKFMMLSLVSTVDHVMKKTPVYFVSDPFLALKGLVEIDRRDG